MGDGLMLYLRWQTAPALMATIGIATSTITPVTLATRTIAAPGPVTVAQLFPNSPYPNSAPRTVALPVGTRIPARYEAAEKIVVAPNETVPLTLTVSKNLRSSGSGELLIPAGSQVSGRVQPARDGAQFVADTLILPDGTRSPISARSDVFTRRQEVQPGVNGDALLKGSAIGAGAATILSGVLGNRRISLGKILLGAGAGAAGGLVFGKRKAEVIAIDSNSDLALTLNSRLLLTRSYQYDLPR